MKINVVSISSPQNIKDIRRHTWVDVKEMVKMLEFIIFKLLFAFMNLHSVPITS